MNSCLTNFMNYERKDKEVYEFSFCWNGFKFHIIYGTMNNGDREKWFIAIPDMDVSCVAAEPMNIYSNEEQLYKLFHYSDKAKAVALAIMMHYETRKEG